MPAKSDSTRPPDAIALFRNFKPLHGIIHYYVDLSCFLVLGTRRKDWWALNRRKRRSSLYSLELQYRSTEARERDLARGFARVERGKRAARIERLGFVDLFVPVVKRGRVLGSLQAGAFAEAELSLEALDQCWRELSGLEPSSELAEYRDFARTLLEIPVLDGPLSHAFQEALELFAGLLGGSRDPESVGERTRELLRGVFAKRLPHSYWLDWALGRPSSESTPYWDRRMETWPWTRDEIGLTRIPTTVLALMPRRPAPGSSWAAERVRVAAFQRRAFRWAQSLPETVGGALEDYGAVFVSSADPGLSRPAQRRQLLDWSRRVIDFAQRELDGPVLSGLGESVAPGELLHRSYHQAALSLHLESAPSPRLIFYGEGGGRRQQGKQQLRQRLNALDRLYAEAAFDTLPALIDSYLSLVLELSFQNPREIKLHLSHALDRLGGATSRRLGLTRPEELALRESLASALDSAAQAQEMVGAFRDSLSRLRERSLNPAGVRRRLSIQESREYIDAHLSQALSLTRLSGLAGISPSTFSREFKRLSGEGLEAYLQSRRLAQAEALLRTSSNSVQRVARDCGFKSGAYFTRLFRQKFGIPPGAYRNQIRQISR